MASLWDFSSLFSSFNAKIILDDKDPKYDILTNEMTSQLEQINKNLSLLENNDFFNLDKFSLLSSPSEFPLSPPTFSPINTLNNSNNFTQTQTQKQQEISKQHNIITPPSTERSAPRKHSKEKTRLCSFSNFFSNDIRDSKKLKPEFSTIAKLPLLSNKFKGSNINDKPIFRVTPKEIFFSNFVLSKTYKFRFTLQNISTHTHGFQVLGPNDPAFCFHILEEVNSSLIRPGLQVSFEIIFKPTEPRDYISDCVIISGDSMAQNNPSQGSNYCSTFCNSPACNDNKRTVVHINCCRDPPEIEVPDIVDLKSTLVHSSKSGSFTITNHGGVAFFSFKSLSGREDSLMFTDGSFTLSPSQFQLAKEESIEITIKFKPRCIGKQSSSFEIVAQHFAQHFYFMAQGNSVTPDLKFKICSDNKFLFVPFLPLDINTTKKIEIFNDCDLPFPFHIKILNPNDSSESILKHLYSDIDIDNNNKENLYSSSNLHFNIVPLSGQISPKETISITITFTPKFFGFFRSNLSIFVDGIPDAAGSLRPKKMLTIGVEAYSGIADLFIHPHLVIFNSVIPTTNSSEMLEIINNSYLNIKLKWPSNQFVKPSDSDLNSLSTEFLFHQKKTIKLNFLLSTPYCTFPLSVAWKLFKRHPRCAKQFLKKLSNNEQHSELSNKIDNEDISNLNVKSDCSILLEPNENNFLHAAAEVINEKKKLINDNESTIHSDNSNEANIKNDYEVGESKNHDEIPNIFSPRSININSQENNSALPAVYYPDKTSQDVDNSQGLYMKFNYFTHIGKPELSIQPSTIDFGFILSGEAGKQILNLTNKTNCPIHYQIEIPQSEEECESKVHNSGEDNTPIGKDNDEIIISKCNGVVTSNTNLPIEIILNIKRITKVDRFITIKSWWFINKNDKIISIPSSEFNVKILACIDRPLLGFENRIVDIGTVYPTLKYNASFEFKLLNSFPTPFWVDDFLGSVKFERKIDTDELKNKRDLKINPLLTRICDNRSKSAFKYLAKSLPPLGQNDNKNYNHDTPKHNQNERPPTNISEYFEKIDFDNMILASNKIEIQQSTITEPKSGNIEIGDKIKLNVSSSFAELGNQVFPIVVNIKGNKYTCAIVAHVAPPNLTLLTEKIDFSDDFIICRRSESRISIRNDCGIASSVRLEVNDDCHKVFKLHDIYTHQISPNETVDFPISCYSEVHGDFYGSFKLIIHDLWQTKEITIPLHVKAHRSFFGFQTHTLGYTKWDSKICTNDILYSIMNSYKYGKMTGIEELDFIYFGVCSSELDNEKTINSLNGEGNKVIRRLYIENYSSEPIFIDWDLVNFVKGKKYVNVSFNIEEDGFVKLDFEENEEAKEIEPFRILNERTKINPHDRSLVTVEFTIQKNQGTYRGVLSAKCGEFTQKLGLVAICE
ncbi:hypothetical protein M9Y10_027303 [Tritrichomonas musculus]|uniref:MSP domain-containing protein n=1 Tax=Tritrichomonas musculus TaxID=1915356 RepID=A0ABR2H4H7_9EUKA